MSIFTEEQRKSLLSNDNVESLTSKNIRYSKEFIKKALELRSEGVPAPEIWASSGFDVSFFKPKYFHKTIIRWKEKLESRGIESFETENRGRPKGKKFSSLEEEIEYLKAENAFLKELRALESE